jgi:hypothetical protein
MNIQVYTINSELKSAKKLGWNTFTYPNRFVEDFDNTVVIRMGNSELCQSKDGTLKEFKYCLLYTSPSPRD